MLQSANYLIEYLNSNSTDDKDKFMKYYCQSPYYYCERGLLAFFNYINGKFYDPTCNILDKMYEKSPLDGQMYIGYRNYFM